MGMLQFVIGLVLILAYGYVVFWYPPKKYSKNIFLYIGQWSLDVVFMFGMVGLGCTVLIFRLMMSDVIMKSIFSTRLSWDYMNTVVIDHYISTGWVVMVGFVLFMIGVFKCGEMFSRPIKKSLI